MSAAPIPPRPDGSDPNAATASAAGVSERPTATWSPWEALAIYVLALLIGGLATLPVVQLIEDEDLATMTASAVAAVSTVGVLVAWLTASHPTWLRVLGWPAPGRWWIEIRDTIGFGLVLYPLMAIAVGIVVGLLLEAITGETPRAPEQVPPDLSAVGVAVTSIYALVIAPVHEELFFRGVLFRGVRDRYGLWPGLVASGIGFALIHYIPGPWEDAVLLMGVMLFNGMAIAWWYDRRGTIVAPLVAHMVFNVIGLSIILAMD
jgi:membrane protease YdiL (CAAX protease family)